VQLLEKEQTPAAEQVATWLTVSVAKTAPLQETGVVVSLLQTMHLLVPESQKLDITQSALPLAGSQVSV